MLFHGIREGYPNHPPSVTYVLNHLCYRCPDWALGPGWQMADGRMAKAARFAVVVQFEILVLRRAPEFERAGHAAGR